MGTGESTSQRMFTWSTTLHAAYRVKSMRVGSIRPNVESKTVNPIVEFPSSILRGVKTSVELYDSDVGQLNVPKPPRPQNSELSSQGGRVLSVAFTKLEFTCADVSFFAVKQIFAEIFNDDVK